MQSRVTTMLVWVFAVLGGGALLGVAVGLAVKSAKDSAQPVSDLVADPEPGIAGVTIGMWVANVAWGIGMAATVRRFSAPHRRLPILWWSAAAAGVALLVILAVVRPFAPAALLLAGVVGCWLAPAVLLLAREGAEPGEPDLFARFRSRTASD